MTKTDKKIENKLRVALTAVCDIALDRIDGYQWITHTVNYASFPSSLLVTCAFDSPQALDALKHSKQDSFLQKTIVEHLASANIELKTPSKQIKFIVK